MRADVHYEIVILFLCGAITGSANVTKLVSIALMRAALSFTNITIKALI